jgi:outer membrane protein TolC
MIKRLIMLKMLVCLFGPAFSLLSAQKTVSLDECIRLSLQNNLQVKNGALDLQSVQSRIDEAKSGFLPSVDITGQYQYYLSIPKSLIPAEIFGGTAGDYMEVTFGSEQSSGASLQVSQVFYNQRVFIGLKAAKTAKNLTELQVSRTREDLVYNVSAVYYNLQMIQANLSLLDANLTSLEKIRNVNRTLQANELISKTNLKRLEISYENLKNERTNLQITNEQTYNLLKYLLGLPLTEPLTVVAFNMSEKPTPSLMDYDNVHARSDLMLVKEQIHLAELDKKAAVAEYYPSLAGVYNYGINGFNNKVAPFQTINDRWMKSSYVALQLNIPVFSGFSRVQKVKQKELEVQKAQNNYELLRQSAEKELADAKKNSLSAGNSYDNAKRTLQLAQEVFDGTTTEYQNGLISLTDLLQIQNELTSARNAYSTALIQVKQAEIELRKSVGKLADSY